MSETFNQNHSGIGDNVVNFGKQPFVITDVIVDDIAARLGEPEMVSVNAIGSQKSIAAAQDLVSRLAAKGFAVQLRAIIGTRSPPLESAIEINGSIVSIDASK